MKKIILALALLSSTSMAVTYEYPYLYKDPKVLGMGNAYVAVGGSSSAVFYNPAGIAKINREAGFEVNLVNLTFGYGKNTKNFISDVYDALDAQDGQYLPPDGDDADDQLYALNQVVKKYQGENLYIEMNDYSSVAKKGEKFGFTIGILGSFISNTIPHQGFGADGVIEEHLSATGGPILGLSYDFLNGDLNAGVSLKYLLRKSLDHYYTTREIIEQDDLADYTFNTLAKDGSALGADVGIIYNFGKLKSNHIVNWLNPSVGLSVLNIGDLNFQDAGKIPMTVNAGIAFRPNIPIFNWVFALDYVDITNQYKQDNDKGKRIRAGMEVKLFDNKWAGLALRTGVYQSYLTAGIDLRLLLFNITFVTYQEEIGAYAGQKGDRRYLINIAFGW